MIILDRETIIDGLIELRNEEEYNNKIIIDNITRIIRKKNNRTQMNCLIVLRIKSPPL